jgi:hypothetical protein
MLPALPRDHAMIRQMATKNVPLRNFQSFSKDFEVNFGPASGHAEKLHKSRPQRSSILSLPLEFLLLALDGLPFSLPG